MRKIIILLIVMGITITVNSQDTTKYFISKDYGWQWQRGKFDKSLMLPNDTTLNKLGIAQIGTKIFLFSGGKWSAHSFDTSGLSSRIDAKLNISDTSNMLFNYFKKVDTITLSNRINYNVKYSDTAAMLLNYARKNYVDSSINANVSILDLQDVTNNGATTTNDVTVNKLNATSLNVTGTNGNGHLHLKHQSNDATATGQSTALFANSNGYLKWKNAGNYYSTLAMPQTANRVYTFQNNSYTLADSSDVASKLNISDTSSMLNYYLRKIDTSTLSNRINAKENSLT